MTIDVCHITRLYYFSVCVPSSEGKQTAVLSWEQPSRRHVYSSPYLIKRGIMTSCHLGLYRYMLMLMFKQQNNLKMHF